MPAEVPRDEHLPRPDRALSVISLREAAAPMTNAHSASICQELAFTRTARSTVA